MIFLCISGDYSGFFKFHDFSMHGTFLVIFQVFHDFQSLWEPSVTELQPVESTGTTFSLNIFIINDKDKQCQSVSTLFSKIGIFCKMYIHIALFGDYSITKTVFLRARSTEKNGQYHYI